jgi:outer membrane receptor protein involved in Fe transport
VKSDSWSVFGQATWDITERLELTAGGRFTKDDRKAKQGNTYVHSTDAAYAAIGLWCGGVLPCNPFFSPAGVEIKSDFDDNNFSPEVTLTWRPTDEVTLWAAYLEGYKAGGFSTNTVIVFGKTGPDLTFDAETVDAWEAGVKTTMLDGSLRLNANTYYYKYDDQQVSAFDNRTTSFSINNAASSESKGVEVESEYVVTDNIGLRAQVGYNKAEYTKFPNAPCWSGQTVAEGCVGGVQNLKNETLNFAPEWSGSIGFDFEQPITSELIFGASYDAIYMDDYKAGGRPETLQDSHWKHNARLGVFHADGTWDVTVIGRNLGNELTLGGCADKPGGAPGDIFCQAVRGRQVMLQGTYRM